MSEFNRRIRKPLAASGVLLGAGSAVLLGQALANHINAQPKTTTTHPKFSGPINAQICTNEQLGAMPHCDDSYAANVQNVASTLLTHHNYNERLDNRAETEAIIGGILMAIAIGSGYAALRLPNSPEQSFTAT